MIYLLHFHSPFKHAKHYIGFVEYESGLQRRLDKHAKGSGSKLVAAISKAGIGFTLVRLWPNGDRNYERFLKNKKNAPTLCPICNAKAMNWGIEQVSKNMTLTDNNTLSPVTQPEIKDDSVGITVAIVSIQENANVN